MGILNLNGVERKNHPYIRGDVFGAGLAVHQHPTIGVTGKSYSSPLTESSVNIFPAGRSVATLAHVPALIVESPGKVVQHKEFVRIGPHEKGSHFATTNTARPTFKRTGGPSKTNDVPSNPNAPSTNKMKRPQRSIANHAPEKSTNLSFLRSGGTLGSHPNSTSTVSRWAVTKTGAAG
jgi:hypothetical protein